MDYNPLNKIGGLETIQINRSLVDITLIKCEQIKITHCLMGCKERNQQLFRDVPTEMQRKSKCEKNETTQTE